MKEHKTAMLDDTTLVVTRAIVDRGVSLTDAQRSIIAEFVWQSSTREEMNIAIDNQIEQWKIQGLLLHE